MTSERCGVCGSVTVNRREVTKMNSEKPALRGVLQDDNQDYTKRQTIGKIALWPNQSNKENAPKFRGILETRASSELRYGRRRSNPPLLFLVFADTADASYQKATGVAGRLQYLCHSNFDFMLLYD
jgi:hypothetical protein